MGRKKNEEVWTQFTSKSGGFECNFCKQTYKSENVTKMRKHLMSCFHCPDNIKLKIDQSSTADANLVEKLSDALELASNATDSPLASASSTANTSRASTPNFPRSMTPFLDRMTDKENVGFVFFFCNLFLNLNSIIDAVKYTCFPG